MSIEAEEGLFQVRLRFTDGQGNYSRHYTTAEITIESSRPAVPDVEDFMLFSWGNEVWAAWEPNDDYLTDVDYQSDEDWVEFTEGYAAEGVGEI